MRVNILCDVVFGPPIPWEIVTPVSFIVLVVLAVMLIVQISCLVIAKKNRDDDMIDIYKDKVERFIYYFLFVLGIVVFMSILSKLWLMAIWPFIFALSSMICRFNDRKILSYIWLAIFYIISVPNAF